MITEKFWGIIYLLLAEVSYFILRKYKNIILYKNFNDANYKRRTNLQIPNILIQL